MNADETNNPMVSNHVLIRLDRLERQNRFAKAALTLGFFLLLTAMAPQRAPNAGSTITASQIVLVRSDGRLFAKIGVDEGRNDLVLSGEDGKRRLWISGLAGLNSPPVTAVTLTDPGQAMSVRLSADSNEALVSLSTPDDRPFAVDTQLPSRSRIVVVKVDKQAGGLSIIDPGGKVRLQLP